MVTARKRRKEKQEQRERRAREAEERKQRIKAAQADWTSIQLVDPFREVLVPLLLADPVVDPSRLRRYKANMTLLESFGDILMYAKSDYWDDPLLVMRLVCRMWCRDIVHAVSRVVVDIPRLFPPPSGLRPRWYHPHIEPSWCHDALLRVLPLARTVVLYKNDKKKPVDDKKLAPIVENIVGVLQNRHSSLQFMWNFKIVSDPKHINALQVALQDKVLWLHLNPMDKYTPPQPRWRRRVIREIPGVNPK